MYVMNAQMMTEWMDEWMDGGCMDEYMNISMKYNIKIK